MSTPTLERPAQAPGPTDGPGASPAPTRRRPSPRARRIALVVAALATIAGVKLVTVGWLSNSGVDAYEREDYGAAEVAFERLSIANVVQRWMAPFDLGVARAANDDLTGAESAFRTSLRLDPARCERASTWPPPSRRSATTSKAAPATPWRASATRTRWPSPRRAPAIPRSSRGTAWPSSSTACVRS